LELTFDRVLGILGVVLTVVLVVLDKAGKLKGPVLFVLLGIAALMALPIALGNSWVKDTPWGILKFNKGMLMVSLVAVCYSSAALWITPHDKLPEPNTEAAKPPASSLQPETPTPPSIHQEQKKPVVPHPPAAESSKSEVTLDKNHPPAERSVSQNNSGGVNVQQTTTGDNSPIINSPITVGTVAMRIPEAKKLEIISVLAQHPARIGVTLVQGGDSEFARDWRDVLIAAGWETGGGGIGSFIPTSGDMDGIWINIPGDVPKDGRVWIGTDTPQAALREAARILGIEPKFAQSPTPGGGIMFCVGAQKKQ